VGAGHLMKLSERQMNDAIGMFVAGNTALNQGRLGSLSNWKAFAAADACQKAMFQLSLVQGGMTGPRQMFEGRDGFFNVINRKQFELPLLGAPYSIMRTVIKRFSLGLFAQNVAQAAIEVRQSISSVGDIQEVNISVQTNAIKIMADTPDKWRPQNRETADHSLPYAAAVVLMYGKIDSEHYADRYLQDPQLLDLVSKINVAPSEEADRMAKELNLCELELVLKSGARKKVRVEHSRGHFKNRMTDAEMEEKFRSLALKQLPPNRVENLLQLIWNLESVPHASALIAATLV